MSDPSPIETLSDGLLRILKDRKELQRQLKARDDKIAKLQAELAEAKLWQGRLHEKCMALEAIPDGVMDGWDERFLFDHDSVVYFKRLAGGRERLVMERRGYPKVVLNAKRGTPLLREALEVASGRKRTSPKQEA